MQLNRRDLLAGATASALARPAKAFSPHVKSAIPNVPKGWNTLPLGAGGLITGFSFALDGTERFICRTDVGGLWLWTGTFSNYTDPEQHWIPALTLASVGAQHPGLILDSTIAPGDSNYLYAIFPFRAEFKLFHSSNFGATWKASNLTYPTATSLDRWRYAQKRLAVDPVNPLVVYTGNVQSSKNTNGVYRAIDGHTFTPISGIPAPTTAPGVAGICFDPSYSAPVVIDGQKRTARIIISTGGRGIFESLDGGINFNEIAISSGAFDSSEFAVFQADMDASGTYYASITSSTLMQKVSLWRYQSGTWTCLIPKAISLGILLVDTRSNHEGFVTYCDNGISNGYSSHNANSARPSFTHQSGGRFYLNAADYDIAWVGQQNTSPTGFKFGTCLAIDPNGVCWGSGMQTIFYFNSILDFTVSNVNTVNSVGRGIEAVVSQDALDAPGALYPVLASQDVGIMQPTYTAYPNRFWDSRLGRMDGSCLEYCASDPSFYTVKVDTESNARHASAYSTNYGREGTWSPYATQPDMMYTARVIAGLSNGAGGPGNILKVTSVAFGHVVQGEYVRIGRRNFGIIQPYGHGGTSGTGGVGTYLVNTTTNYVAPGTSLNLDNLSTVVGQIVAVDHDHHVCVPMGYNGAFTPVYTTNATSPSCSWNFCNGLPCFTWFNRSFVFGPTVRPLAVGYDNDIGLVWAFQYVPGRKSVIYRSRDAGATWNPLLTFPTPAIQSLGGQILSVPGKPGELWLSAFFTANSTIWHVSGANGASPRVSVVNNPTSDPLTNQLTMGAPAMAGDYPILYGTFSAAYNKLPNIYRGIWDGRRVLWTRLFSVSDLPVRAQESNIAKIRGSFNKSGRLFLMNQSTGYSYYEPP